MQQWQVFVLGVSLGFLACACCTFPALFFEWQNRKEKRKKRLAVIRGSSHEARGWKPVEEYLEFPDLPNVGRRSKNENH